MREQLQRVFVETATTTVLVSHDLEEAVYLLGPDPAALASSGARGRICPLRRGPAAHAADDVGGPISSAPRHTASNFPARGAQGMKKHETPADIAAVCRGGVLLAVWSLTVWARVVDRCCCRHDLDVRAMWVGMKPAAKLGLDFLKTVGGTVYSTAIAAVIAIPLGVLLGSSEKIYRSVGVPDRLLPLDRRHRRCFPLFLVLFGVGDRTKISVAAFGAAAGDPVQRRLRVNERLQDTHSGREG